MNKHDYLFAVFLAIIFFSIIAGNAENEPSANSYYWAVKR